MTFTEKNDFDVDFFDYKEHVKMELFPLIKKTDSWFLHCDELELEVEKIRKNLKPEDITSILEFVCAKLETSEYNKKLLDKDIIFWIKKALETEAEAESLNKIKYVIGLIECYENSDARILYELAKNKHAKAEYALGHWLLKNNLHNQDDVRHESNSSKYYLNNFIGEKNDAFNFFVRSAKNGCSDAMVWVGSFHYQKRKYLNAIKWYKKAAKKDYMGNPLLNYRIANCYFSSCCFDKIEEKKTTIRLKKAVDNYRQIAKKGPFVSSVQSDFRFNASLIILLSFFDKKYCLNLTEEEVDDYLSYVGGKISYLAKKENKSQNLSHLFYDILNDLCSKLDVKINLNLASKITIKNSAIIAFNSVKEMKTEEAKLIFALEKIIEKYGS